MNYDDHFRLRIVNQNGPAINYWQNKGSFDNINSALEDVAEAAAERHERDDRVAEAQIAMRDEVVELRRKLQEESEARHEQHRRDQETVSQQRRESEAREQAAEAAEARRRRWESWRWMITTMIAGASFIVAVISFLQGKSG